MKKLLFALFALTLMVGQVFASDGLDTSPGRGDVLGQSGTLAQNRHRIFRTVRYVPPSANADSETLSKNCLVIWDRTSDDGVSVTTTATSGDNGVAGITATNALTPETIGNTATQDIDGRNWCFIQTYGLADVIVQSGGKVNAGSKFGTSTAKGFANEFNWYGLSGDSVRGNAGVAMDTTSGNNVLTVKVFLQLD